MPGRPMRFPVFLLLAVVPAILAFPQDWDRQRGAMVDRQIAARGVRDPRVLEAMRSVPRHLFVPEELRTHAYDGSWVPTVFPAGRQTLLDAAKP